MKPTIAASVSLLALLLAAAAATAPQDHSYGYKDTPLVPGTTWHVHDPDRPLPRVVTPGIGPEMRNTPPSDAIVLFDGKDLAQWRTANGAAKWKVENGYMEVNGTGSIETVEAFGDCQLHLEFQTPAKADGESQGRGNSGVFLMGLYELQVLDSFENRTYADGQAGALYGQMPPLVNACRKPGEWQSYDVVFRAPRWEGEDLASNARVTVLQNGVVVQDAQPFLGATAHRAVAQYSKHAEALPLQLQDHGNPVRYRNVWVRRL